jgi:glycerol-3-phosphate O-acyltransferase
VHFFVRGAIAEVSLLAVQATGSQGMAEFRQQATLLRELLKFEFAFEEPLEFIQGLEKELDSRMPGWRGAVEQGPAAVHKFVSSLPVIFGYGALRPFLEAYTLVAEALALLSADQPADAKTLMARSMALGRQRLLQRRIRCEESVSSSYFENAIRIAEERGCLQSSQAAVQQRATLLQQLSAAVSKTQVLGSLADSRRVQRYLHK